MDQLEFGKRIQHIRSEMGLSQLEFADLCNLQHGHLSNIERGKRSIRIDTMSKIAEALNMSLAELIGDSKKDLFEDEAMRYLHNYFGAMKPEARKEVVGIIMKIKRIESL